MPVEPEASRFRLPSPYESDEYGRVAVGGDLEPGTLLQAYRAGLFPMRSAVDEVTWWSPDPRGILELDALRVSDSLRRSCRRFAIRVDTAFEAVIDACADRRQEEHDWITPELRDAYVRLHELGWAHSVEAWAPETDHAPELAGGLYGVAVGGLFAGESMFSHRTDASKVSLVALVGLLRDDGHDGEGRLIDVQWLTPHLASLGAVEVGREDYLERLQTALELPLPAPFVAR